MPPFAPSSTGGSRPSVLALTRPHTEDQGGDQGCEPSAAQGLPKDSAAWLLTQHNNGTAAALGHPAVPRLLARRCYKYPGRACSSNTAGRTAAAHGVCACACGMCKGHARGGGGGGGGSTAADPYPPTPAKLSHTAVARRWAILSSPAGSTPRRRAPRARPAAAPPPRLER